MAATDLAPKLTAARRADAHGIVSFPPVLEANRYQSQLYEALARHGYTVIDGHLKLRWLLRNRRRARVLHFHWPQPYYRHNPTKTGALDWVKVGLFTLRLGAARVLGYRIAWTIHELYPLGVPQEELAPDRLALRVLARLGNVLVANDAETATGAGREFAVPAGRIEIVPHSSYVGVYAAGRSRADVRQELGIGEDTIVFLVFGHISSYKKVDWFVEAFRAADLPDAALVVAGLVMDEPSAARVREAAAADPRIKPLLEFIPDDRVGELFAAADLAICPRQDGGTSAVVILALSMSVPPVVAAVSTYESLTGGEEAAWTFEPYDRDSLIATLERAAGDREGNAARAARGRERVAGLSWDGMAGRLAELFGRPRRG